MSASVRDSPAYLLEFSSNLLTLSMRHACRGYQVNNINKKRSCFMKGFVYYTLTLLYNVHISEQKIKELN